jgi:hypothetical protein
MAKELGANQYLGDFIENSNRRWRLAALSSGKGIAVVWWQPIRASLTGQ